MHLFGKKRSFFFFQIPFGFFEGELTLHLHEGIGICHMCLRKMETQKFNKNLRELCSSIELCSTAKGGGGANRKKAENFTSEQFPPSRRS